MATTPGLIQSSAKIRLRFSPCIRQQRFHVEHHSLDASRDRTGAKQTLQVQSGGSQRSHHSGAISLVAVGVLMELGVPEPGPALSAPSVRQSLPPGFWGGTEARQKQADRLNEFQSSLPLAVSTTIQLVPIQVSVMCTGACLACSIQMMIRPWPTSWWHVSQGSLRL
jgi:hypothetical protein